MKKLLTIGSMLVLAACSLQPPYERPAAPVAGEFPTGAAYKATPAGGSPAVDIGWRDFLADPRLQRLVEIALENNRDLRVAMLNVAQVQAQYRIQRAALFPQVGGFTDASRSRIPESTATVGRPTTVQDYSVGLSGAWEIDFFGRLESLKDAALQQYLATAHARQAAEILLVSQVADQYLTMLALDEQLAVTRQTLKTAQASYKIVKLQFDTGTGAELSLRQSETVVEQANANYAAQLRARAQAENALVLLLGQPLPPDLPPQLRLGEQPILADIPAGLPSDLLTRRPDILQAEASLACGERQHRRRAGGILSADQPHRKLWNGERDARRIVRGRIARLVLPAGDHGADLPGRRKRRQPGPRMDPEGYRDRAVREGDPERVSRGRGRPRCTRHVR